MNYQPQRPVQGIISQNRKYEEMSRKSINEICSNWENRWLQLEKRYGNKIHTYDKGLAKSALVAMIKKHFELHYYSSLRNTAEYIKDMIFKSPPPNSIARATILNQQEFYETLAEIMNKIEKREKNDRNNHHYPRNPNPPQTTQTF